MAVTGYLGLPAEMANIHLRPPTRSRERERTWIALLAVHGRAVVPHAGAYDRPAPLSLDTHSLRLIIVIYAPTTNAISLIRSSWVEPTSACWTEKLMPLSSGASSRRFSRRKTLL